MLREIFGCCDQLVSLGGYERKPKYTGFQKSGRNSRFLEVTTDPFNFNRDRIESFPSKPYNKTL